MSALDNIDEDALGFFDETTAPPTNANPLADVMIDLETMGTRPNAPIIAIGAVTFDSRNLTLGEQFYAVVDLQSSVNLGSVIDADTVMWWMKQSDDARKAFARKGMYASEALTALSSWLDRNCVELKSRRVWACGTDFDCTMLREHYAKAGLGLPWMFWNQRDYRTVRALYPNVEPDERRGLHNALDDAIYQVEHFFKIRRTLRGKNA